MQVPEVRYTRSDEFDIAYQVFGEGATDIIVVKPGTSHLEVMWEHPLVAEFYERLSSFARVIVYDPRGFGLSSHVDLSRIGRWEEQMDDLMATLAAAGSERPVVLSLGPASTLALLTTSVHAASVSSLVMLNGVARLTATDDYPWSGRGSRSQHP